MSQQSEQEMELGLADLAEPIQPPKVVGKIGVQEVESRVGVKNSSGSYGNTQMSQALKDNLDEQVEDVISLIIGASAHSDEMEEVTKTLNALGNAEMNSPNGVSSSFLNRRSLRDMKGDTTGSGSAEVAKGLGELRQKMESLNPNKHKNLFQKSSKLLGFLPFGLGKKTDSYFKDFQNANDHLNEIMTSLYHGKDQLIEDNAEIDVERKKLYKVMKRLEQYAYILQKVDEKITQRLPEIEAEDRIKAEDVQKEILFPVRNKTKAILAQLAVSFQGYLALQVAKQNNIELINSVDMTTSTTMQALRTAIIVSEVLSSQKIVLTAVKEVNAYGNKLIEQNAQMLSQNAGMIQQQSVESAIDIEMLSKAFEQTFHAMDQVDKYRIEALPKLQQTISNLQDTINGAKGYMESRRQENVSEFAKELKEVDEPENALGAVKIKLKK